MGSGTTSLRPSGQWEDGEPKRPKSSGRDSWSPVRWKVTNYRPNESHSSFLPNSLPPSIFINNAPTCLAQPSSNTCIPQRWIQGGKGERIRPQEKKEMHATHSLSYRCEVWKESKCRKENRCEITFQMKKEKSTKKNVPDAKAAPKVGNKVNVNIHSWKKVL